MSAGLPDGLSIDLPDGLPLITRTPTSEGVSNRAPV
jgi:hypothetical protein